MCSKSRKQWLAVLALYLFTLPPTLALAGKPDKPGGGGGEPANALLIAQLDAGGDAADINDLREVVGAVTTESGDSVAAYWTVTESNGLITSNRTLLWDGYLAYAINNHGEIVGESFDSFGNYVAIYWPDSSSAAVELPSLPDHPISVAQGINNDGLICGYVSKNVLDDNDNPIPGTVDVPAHRAVVWRVLPTDGAPIISGPFELPSDGDDSNSAANALNDNDEFGIAEVVGYRASAVSGEGGPFLWGVKSLDDGTVSILTIPLLGDGMPIGVNNNGVICGRLIGRSGEEDALVWSGDTVSFLDRGKGRNKVPAAWALDINESGLIVGWAGTYIDSHACFWDGIEGTVTYLDDYLESDSPLLGLIRARDVNAFGDIVGIGQTGSFIAIPVSQ